jgi:hypothetical protein
VNKRKRLNGPALCDRPSHLSSADPNSVENGPGPIRPNADRACAQSHRSPLRQTAGAHSLPPPLVLDPRPRIHAAPRSPSPLSAVEPKRSSPSLLAAARMGCHRSAPRTPLQRCRATPLCCATAPRHHWLSPRVPQSHTELVVPKPLVPKLHPSAGTVRPGWGKHLAIEMLLQPLSADKRTSPSYEAAPHNSPT